LRDHADMITSVAPSPPARTGGLHRRPAALTALAILVGATLAALGAAAGAWVGWRDVPPLTFETTSGLAAVVAADARPETLEQVSPSATWLNRGAGTAGVLPVLLGGERFGSGYERIVVRTGERNDTLVTATASRLQAMGWTAERADDGVALTRDGLHLRVWAAANPGDGGAGAATESVTLLVQREEPARVLPLALGGAAVGAMVGALAAVLLGRLRAAVGASFLVAVVALLPLTVTGLGGLALRLAGVEIPIEWQRGGVIAAALSLVWLLLVIAVLGVGGAVVGLLRLGRSPAPSPKV
jgi:hypothetical protein